jgi:hypothetical protein
MNSTTAAARVNMSCGHSPSGSLVLRSVIVLASSIGALDVDGAKATMLTPVRAEPVARSKFRGSAPGYQSAVDRPGTAAHEMARSRSPTLPGRALMAEPGRPAVQRRQIRAV